MYYMGGEHQGLDVHVLNQPLLWHAFLHPIPLTVQTCPSLCDALPDSTPVTLVTLQI